MSVARRYSESRNAAARLAARAARGVLPGIEPAFILRERDARRRSNVVVCWDERSGACAALRSRLSTEPPVATGVIWATERGSTVPSLVQTGLRSAAAVWALSSAQLDVIARWGIPARRLHHLTMGVDAAFWTAEPGVEQDPDLVLAVGNDRHRDHAALVEAVDAVRNRRPGTRLVLVSKHPVDVPPELGVRIPGCSHDELRTLYAKAAVVAFALTPNLHVSGMTALLEAMACGRAVVATRTPGIGGYVRDGQTGVLVEPGHLPLATAVAELLDDPDRAAEIGAAARSDALARLTTAHQAAQLASILETARR